MKVIPRYNVLYDDKKRIITHVPHKNGEWCRFSDFIAYAMEISEYVDTEKYFEAKEKADEAVKPQGGG